MTALTRAAVGMAAICLGAAATRAQTDLRGWYAAGQTWLVWEDTDPTPDTYRIYGSTVEIKDLSQAMMIGRLFPQDWQAARLKLADIQLNWTIPAGTGGDYQLADNEALFVHTPHAAGPRYFAVVKDGSAEVGPENSTGPIVQSVEPIQCHLQKSGLVRGHSYRIFAHWIDGHDSGIPSRPDYPVMGNQHFNGTAAVFQVWDPQAGKGSNLVPAAVALHGGGGSFLQFRPVFPFSGEPTPFHLLDGLLISPDDTAFIRHAFGVGAERTLWLGYWEGYDRFTLPEEQSVPDDALIADYTMWRLDWMVQWITEAEGIDPTRISVMGFSMGGRGTFYNTRRHPERYSTGTAFAPGIAPFDESVLHGNRSQNLRTPLPGSPTMEEVTNPSVPISNSERDMPFTRIISGRADRNPFGSGWSAERVQQLGQVNDAGFGHHVYWDERGHRLVEPGDHWNGSPRLTAQGMTRYRSDQSFPAFFNDDQDATLEGRQPDPGDGDPAIGEPWGTWSGYYDWDLDTIEDTPSQWAATVFLVSSSSFENDVPAFDSSTADIAIRRPQHFHPAPGSVFDWALRPLSDSKATQIGMGIVDPDGVVVIPNLTITKTPSRLTVTSTVHEITGVLDAASFQPLISPGSIVSVFGTFSAMSSTSPGIPLNTSLDGFSVTFNGQPGALFGVFGEDFGLGFHQANVQVPWQIDVSDGSLEVQVHWESDEADVWSEPFQVPAALASPGIFQFPIGSGQAIVTNFKLSAEDDVIARSFAQPPASVDPVVAQPAAIGGVVSIWCNGLGPVTPEVPTGDIPAGEVPVTTKTVRVSIGGVSAAIIGTAVLQPTNVGLNQINVFVPEGVTPGDRVPIVIEVDCGEGKVFRSREDVTIAVRAVP